MIISKFVQDNKVVIIKSFFLNNRIIADVYYDKENKLFKTIIYDFTNWKKRNYDKNGIFINEIFLPKPNK